MALEIVFYVSGCFAGMRCGLIRCTVSSALGNETIKRDFDCIYVLMKMKWNKTVLCAVSFCQIENGRLKWDGLGIVLQTGKWDGKWDISKPFREMDGKWAE